MARATPISSKGKRFPSAFSWLGFRLPLTAFLLISLTLATLAGCGGGGGNDPAPTPRATIALSPAALTFTGTAGGANPANQTVTLSNTGTATLNFTATAAPTAPPAWLAVTPTSGSVGAGVSTSLTVSVNLATLTAGSFTGSISVSDPAASNSPQSVSVSLTVNPPALAVTSISPRSARAGGAAFTLTVTGTGFVSNSVVRWNGTDRTTTFVSTTQLTAAIPASDIATPGTAQVTVFNPGPDGGTSNAVTFTIIDLTITSISPPSAVAGGPAFTLTVNGTGFRGSSTPFDPGTLVQWNRSFRTTSFVSSTRLTASITAADIAAPGTADVRVVDPRRGVASNVVPFGITQRTPGVGVIERVSVASDGAEGNSGSFSPSISADGRFVAFASQASKLVAGDTNGVEDTFVHDRQTDQTTRVSLASDGAEGSGFSPFASISADGRLAAFHSNASNLVAPDTNVFDDVFVHDRQTGQTTRVSVASGGTEGNGSSVNASISADGRFVAFHSNASNLVAGDTNAASDIFFHDRQTGQTTRVGLANDGTEGNSSSSFPSISADGRFVAFGSSASNLVPGDTNRRDDIFLRDTCVGAPAGCVPSTVRVSVASDGSQGNLGSTFPVISADGRFVAFESNASNLVAGDSNGFADIFVATTEQVGTPVIITTSLPGGTLGTAYSATLKDIGGMPPFTWSIDEGGAALPPGVTLDPSSGVLSGVPMLAGTFNFTARVTDSASPAQCDTQRFILTVR